MEYIEKKVRVPKELQECLDCLKVVIERVKAKDELSVVVASAIPPFLKAIEGVQEVPVEVKEDLKASVNAGVLFGSEVVSIFLPGAKDKHVQPKPAVVAKAKFRKGVMSGEIKSV